MCSDFANCIRLYAMGVPIYMPSRDTLPLYVSQEGCAKSHFLHRCWNLSRALLG